MFFFFAQDCSCSRSSPLLQFGLPNECEGTAGGSGRPRQRDRTQIVIAS